MKLWFRLTLVGCILLCLFLSPPQAVGLNHRLPIVGSRPWFDPGREPASDASAVWVVRSMEFPARAGRRQSLLLDCTLTAGNTGPPGWETHAPAAAIRPWRVADQAGNSKKAIQQLFSAKLLAQLVELEDRSFATRFS